MIETIIKHIRYSDGRNIGSRGTPVIYGPAQPLGGQFYVVPINTAIDSSTGVITGSSESLLKSPAHQAALVLLRYADGVTDANMSFSTSTDPVGFGSVRRAATLLDDWAQNVDGGGSETFDTAVRINDPTTVAGAISLICENTPLMVYRKPDGSFNFCVYPNSRDTIPTQLRYVNNAGSTVYFHPNSHHASASRYGQPYGLADFRAYLSPVEEVFNSFRIEYNFHPPTNTFSFYQSANADAYRIWDQTTQTFETTGNTLGGNIDTACTASESRLGYRREMPLLQLGNVNDDVTAAAILDYWSQRYTKRRVIIEATAFLEAYDLVPGHVINIDNDMNLTFPVPSYGFEDWEDLDFIVLEVRYLPDPAGLKVWFRAEQLARV